MPFAHKVSLHSTKEQLPIISTGNVTVDIPMTIFRDLKLQVRSQIFKRRGLRNVHRCDQCLDGRASERLVRCQC